MHLFNQRLWTKQKGRKLKFFDTGTMILLYFTIEVAVQIPELLDTNYTLLLQKYSSKYQRAVKKIIINVKLFQGFIILRTVAVSERC